MRVLALSFLALLAACGTDQPGRLRPPPGPPTGATTIHVPDRLTSIPTGEVDALGRPQRAPCVGCHSLRRPARLPSSVDELDEFHQGLRFVHGGVSCASCHVVGDQDVLHRADGTIIPMVDVLQLCAQCHGPQYRDYLHGAHGGMNGAWDLSSGDRVRNNCVDCHDPHQPAFQPSVPVLPPRDRGVLQGRGAR
ncbi:MAG: hypothetical protein H6709_13645 [Kofleriaceae bacterium]|nr:hypothetical protein [Myxococcales bacterium]MCB9561953.1 hypothetical protein [Kofleriaceae bacterium]MCB9573122.1 hypothetical protein [Kofleriaceae bacterium]